MGKGKRQAASKRAFFRGKATVFGRVTTGRSKKPVAGAEVTVKIDVIDMSKGWPPCAKQEVKAVADDKGRYEATIAALKDFDEKAFGAYFSVSAEAARFVPERVMPARAKSQLPTAGKRVKADVALKPAFAVAGRVVDEKGRPIKGVKVIVYQTSSYGCCNPSLVGGDWPKTNAKGEFLADGMPRGLPTEQRQVAGFFHDDYQRRFIQRIGDLPRDPGGVAHLGDVALAKGLRLSGTVRDARGRPVPKANVLVTAAEPYQGDPGCARPPAKWGLRTDANGRYAANGLPPMYYNVIVTHRSHGPGTRMDVKLMTRSRSGVDVVLDKAAGVLAGTVTAADGSPAANVKLSVWQYLGGIDRRATTDKRGRYRMHGSAPHVAAVFEGFSDMDMLAWFDPPNEQADIRLPAEVTVTGRLVDARTGRPIAAKKDLLLGKSPYWGRGFRAESAARSGEFEVSGVWPGRYYLCVRADSGALISREVAVKAPRCDLGDVPIHAGVTLTGKVLTSTGRPIRNAEVFIDGPLFYDGMATRTDSGGRYSLKGLSDGTYQLRVRAAGWATFYQQELELPAKGGRFVKDVRLSKGVSLCGSVLDGGKPVERQIVVLARRRVRGRPQKRPWVADTNTDEAGRFVFPNVMPGKYVIRCGLSERNITVERGKANVCRFRWPGRFKPEPHKSKGGCAV